MAPDDIAPGAVSQPPAPPKFMEGAVSLPAAAYTDPEIHTRELELCFRKGWMSIASIGQLPKTGDVLAVEAVGEPLLVTKDRKGEIHVFYNVCRHRGIKLMADGATHCGTGLVTCPYHKWSYALDGALKAAPYWTGAKDSSPSAEEKSEMGLIPVRSAVWCGMVYVNLSGDAEPFEDFIRPLADRWTCFDFSLLRQATLNEWTVPTNWKFAVENALDLYHLPWVHPELGTAEQSFSGIVHTYLTERIFGYVMSEFDRARETAEVVADLFPNLDPAFEYALDLIYVFPNTFFLVTPTWVQIVSVTPRGPGVTRELLAGYLVGDDMMTEKWAAYRPEFGGWLKMVNDQDVGILIGLQEGRATSATDKGIYAPYWDQLAEYFAKAVQRTIAA
jgi:phenylpropionate dioxygenase-like ring-hydroxylating dioxygenase large terminal subunit